MKLNLPQRIKQLNKAHRKKSKWRSVLVTLSAIVVFCTTYSLILPAITMGDKTVCGDAEHIHTDECYCEESVLACNISQTEGYSHSDECYEEKEIIVCGKTECNSHKHNDDCYNDDDKLVCELEETEGHKHSDDCKSIQKVLICDKEEQEAHHHSDDCYKLEKKLVCEKTEHTHTAECYDENKTEDVTTEEVIAKTDNSTDIQVSNATLNSDDIEPNGTHDRLYSDVYMYYEYPPYELDYFDTLTNKDSSTTCCTFALVPVGEDTYKWTPNPASGWTATGKSNYDVTYCADINVYTSGDGDVYYDSMPIEDANLFTDEQITKLTAIVQNAYPFISAEQALKDIRDAGYTLSDNCSLAELVTGTQWAIWQTANNADIYGANSAVTWNLSDSVKNVTIHPLVDATPYSSTVKSDIQKIHDYLVSRTAYIKEKVTIASKEIVNIKENDNGTCAVTMKVSLNRALTEDESAYITITDSNSNTSTVTVPHNTKEFEITLDNVSKDAEYITVDFSGSSSETYLSPVFYEGYDYQDMISAKPITPTYSDRARLSFGAETNVSVKKEWDGTVGADSVKVTLLANGEQYGEPVTLNSSNNWSYEWKNLPSGSLTERITYTVKETPVSGYYTDISYKDVENKTAIQSWTEASSLEDGKTYMIVSSSGALASQNNSSGNIQWLSTDTSSVTDNQQPAMWTATKTSDGFKLTNKQSGNNLALIYSSWSYRFYEKVSNTNRYSEAFNYSNGKLSAKYSNTSYYLTSVSSGYASSSTSSSSGTSFTLYELQEEYFTNYEQEFTITNIESEELTSVQATKNWVGADGEKLQDTPESVKIRLYANDEQYGDPVILNNDNQWSYLWSGLPKKDIDGNLINYKVEEDPVEGFETSISSNATETSETEAIWKSATSLEDGKTYIFVTNGKALSKTDSDNDLLELKSVDITNVDNTSGLSMWTATKSGSGFKLTNVAKTDRTLALYSRRVFLTTTRRFVAANNSSSDINTRELQYSNKNLTASSYKFGAISDGYGSASSSSGTEFELYELAEQTITESQTDFTITNREMSKLVTLSVKKTDSEDPEKTLSNAVFDLYRESNARTNTEIPSTDGKFGVKVYEDITTDVNGYFSAEGLSENVSYYLVETEAPKGYNRLSEPIEFKIADGAISVENNEMAQDISDDDEVILMVKNELGYTLPATGGKGTYLVTLGGSLLVFAALILLYRKRYKEVNASL